MTKELDRSGPDRGHLTTPGVRIVDRFDPRLINILTILGFGLPVAGYLWLLHRYSVNVIVGDQWDDVTVIGHSYTGVIDWSSLWAQHNENRIFFPNLIVIALSRTTHFNIQVEEYLSAAMLIAATGLLIWTHKRRFAQTPWLYYCPVAILALSVVQFENMLWGFQMAWYLVLLALASSIALLDRESLNWLTLIGAAGIAVVGSFSSLQGLLIWPIGLLLMYFRHRRIAFFYVWIAAALATAVLYFHNFNSASATPNHNYVFQHPFVALKFFLFALGDVVGLHIPFHGPLNVGVVLIGLIILILAVVTLARFRPSRLPDAGAPIGIALICFGLMFACIVTLGRATLGYWVASGSRYTTFNLLTLIGIYLVAVDQRTLAASGPDDEAPQGRSIERQVGPGLLRNHSANRIVQIAIAIVIVIQIVLGLNNGIDGARTNHTNQILAAHVLKNIDRSSDLSVETALYLFKPASFVRQRARIAQRYHLSVFSSSSP